MTEAGKHFRWQRARQATCRASRLGTVADQGYYTQTAGRFYTPDPIGMAAVDLTNPTGWNTYVYVNDDPVNFYDRALRLCRHINTPCSLYLS